MNNLDELNDLVTVTELATALRVNPETIRRWIKTKKLKAVKMGKSIRISKANLEEYMTRQSTQPGGLRAM